MITAREISDAKERTDYGNEKVLHEHDDCIRIAYEWLDAQAKTKNVTKHRFALKHIIENWGGRYVSQSDVEVAAELHPDIRGSYPYFNISARLTLPSRARLADIFQAKTQHYELTDRTIKETYARQEA
jgi:hypothetical protein